MTPNEGQELPQNPRTTSDKKGRSVQKKGVVLVIKNPSHPLMAQLSEIIRLLNTGEKAKTIFGKIVIG